MTKRQVVFLAAKLVFAVAVIWWLLHRVDVSRVWTSVLAAHVPPILGGIFLCLLTVAIAGWRWHRLLRAFGIIIPLRSLTCIAQIGQFFAMFLPGPTGDDLTRMLYISRLAKGRVGEACATVLLDRVIGLASVLGVALVCIPWQWKSLVISFEAKVITLGIVSAGLAACVGGAVFFALNGRRMLVLVNWLVGLLPENRIKVKLGKIGRLVLVGRRAVGQVVIAAICTQLLLCVLFYLGGAAVGISLPLASWMSFVPIVLAANAVPITIAGLGVREYLLTLFLSVIGGVDAERALAASLVIFSMILAVSLFGGLVYLFFRPEPGAEEEAVEAATEPL